MPLQKLLSMERTIRPAGGLTRSIILLPQEGRTDLANDAQSAQLKRGGTNPLRYGRSSRRSMGRSGGVRTVPGRELQGILGANEPQHYLLCPSRIWLGVFDS